MVYLYILLALLVGTFIGFFVNKSMNKKQIIKSSAAVEKKYKEVEEKANEYKQRILLEGKEELYNEKVNLENSFREERREIVERNNKLLLLTEKLDIKQDSLSKQEHALLEMEKDFLFLKENIQKREEELRCLLIKQEKELERMGKLTFEQAREEFLNLVKEKTTRDVAKLVRSMEEDAKENAKKKAQQIIITTIQRLSSECVSERTVRSVTLPSEDMKGRIIGREGRNIRAFEAATGVDVIIDDTPEVITVSAFDPVRRHVAYMALEILMQDGRIHPARIEEIVKKCESEIAEQIKEYGERAVFDLGIQNMAPELIRVLGTLHFRTSFSQNVLQHSIEVANICGMIAAELGLDIKIAKRSGLLHDIGKAVDHDVEGPHAIIGAELANKYGEQKVIVNAIATHHEDIPFSGPYGFLVQAADCLSGARPGARREVLANYIKRLEDLETIANSFSGVTKSYAIQGGREVRVLVDAEILDDDEAVLVSKNIAEQIESSLVYPGQVRVTVIRESRSIALAK
ncbi:MAG: ribonuclease Y [Desulfovibrionaceae bacterium]